MNKKMYLGAVALSPDRDFSVTLGTKVWLNEWSRDRRFISNVGAAVGEFGIEEIVFASDTAPDAQESDVEPVPIPQLSVRYQWLIVTGGYYSKTGFDFGTSEGTVERIRFTLDDVLWKHFPGQKLKPRASDTSGMPRRASTSIPMSPSWVVTRRYAKRSIL